MRIFILLQLLLFCTFSNANDLKVIEYSNQFKSGEEYFFLIGTPKGNFIIRSWQFDFEKKWNGTGNINLSIDDVINKAYLYFRKSKEELGIAEIALRPSISRQGTTLWYYHVTLTTMPRKFGAEEFQIVVLTSGEVLVPYKPQS